MLLAREINKIAEFYNIFAPKMPEFYIIIARKILFLMFGDTYPTDPPSPIRLCRRRRRRRRRVFVNETGVSVHKRNAEAN